MSEFLIVTYLLGGIAGLYIGAEGLVRGSSSLAMKLGISPLVVGLTIVAFATSSPELVVSIKAAIDGNSGIVVGNVVGSNICNIALILGVAALISPMHVKTQIVRREIPIMIVVSVIMLAVLFDDSISRFEGIILVLGIIVYIIISYSITVKEVPGEEIMKEFKDNLPPKPYSIRVSIFIIIVGLGLLVGGSHLFVDGAVEIAKRMGVSQAVIGLTIIALGTSLPELTTSVVASMKHENEIAIGNAVGSNVFNIFSVLGISSLVAPVAETGVTIVDLSIMMFFAILIFPLSKSEFTLQRWEGGVLLAGYILYMIYLAYA